MGPAIGGGWGSQLSFRSLSEKEAGSLWWPCLSAVAALPIRLPWGFVHCLGPRLLTEGETPGPLAQVLLRIWIRYWQGRDGCRLGIARKDVQCPMGRTEGHSLPTSLEQSQQNWLSRERKQQAPAVKRKVWNVSGDWNGKEGLQCLL